MEDRWLPRLLRSLRQGESWPVIVADNHSSDRTVKIAKENGCTVVQGGTPAVGRNAAASVATTDIIVFVDADVVLTKSVFGAIKTAFSHPSQVVALHCRLQPLSRCYCHRFAYVLLDAYIRAFRRLGIAQGVGSLIAVRTAAFRSVGGFDERLAVGEDVDFLRRVSRVGSVLYRSDVTAWVSARRLSLESPLLFGLKTLMWAGLRLLNSRRSVLGYRWRAYPSTLANLEALAVETVLSSTENAT
jgi:glycosyltransferase involved in cell wall biosynthesis